MAESQPTKVCNKCKAEQPLVDFVRTKQTLSGYKSYCKACQRATNKTPENREKNRLRMQEVVKTGRHKEWWKRYTKSDKYLANYLRKKRSESGRAYQIKYSRTEKGTKVAREHASRYSKKYPEKNRARNAVCNAVRDGRLPKASTQNCYRCGKPANQWHHHNGYSEEHKLDVVPVCRLCHGDEHAKHKLADLIRIADKLNQPSRDEVDNRND